MQAINRGLFYCQKNRADALARIITLDYKEGFGQGPGKFQPIVCKSGLPNEQTKGKELHVIYKQAQRTQQCPNFCQHIARSHYLMTLSLQGFIANTACRIEGQIYNLSDIFRKIAAASHQISNGCFSSWNNSSCLKS